MSSELPKTISYPCKITWYQHVLEMKLYSLTNSHIPLYIHCILAMYTHNIFGQGILSLASWPYRYGLTLMTKKRLHITTKRSLHHMPLAATNVSISLSHVMRLCTQCKFCGNLLDGPYFWKVHVNFVVSINTYVSRSRELISNWLSTCICCIHMWYIW